MTNPTDLDEEFEDEDNYCTTCNGCGEGLYDGTSCNTCGGSGVITAKPDPDDYDPPDDDWRYEWKS